MAPNATSGATHATPATNGAHRLGGGSAVRRPDREERLEKLLLWQPGVGSAPDILVNSQKTLLFQDCGIKHFRTVYVVHIPKKVQKGTLGWVCLGMICELLPYNGTPQFSQVVGFSLVWACGGQIQAVGWRSLMRA